MYYYKDSLGAFKWLLQITFQQIFFALRISHVMSFTFKEIMKIIHEWIFLIKEVPPYPMIFSWGVYNISIWSLLVSLKHDTHTSDINLKS